MLVLHSCGSVKSMYKLWVMSFDGDTILDGTGKTVEELIHRSADMGSKWFFYPFHIITTERGMIKDLYGANKQFQGRYLKTIKQIWHDFSKRNETEGMDAESFLIHIKLNWHKI